MIVALKKLGQLAVEIIEKHPEVAMISRALDRADPFSLAVILEWCPMPQKRAHLFRKFAARREIAKIGGLVKAHFLSAARQAGIPQVILRDLSAKGRNNGRTNTLIQILLEKAVPILRNKQNVAFSPGLMEEAVVI